MEINAAFPMRVPKAKGFVIVKLIVDVKDVIDVKDSDQSQMTRPELNIFEKASAINLQKFVFAYITHVTHNSVTRNNNVDNQAWIVLG